MAPRNGWLWARSWATAPTIQTTSRTTKERIMDSSKQNEILKYLKSGAGGSFHGVDSYDVILRALSHSKIEGVGCRGQSPFYA